ncbi:MAG: ParB/RepB/Spo0J family partition protein [Clostridia bacterium]|nr:ParB/RepB/Spo0J family partition protein [Clostridia bacterium]MDY2929669.1 ParB/RepB/Spo0J family partition protein [Clostridiaceae bacterium]
MAKAKGLGRGLDALFGDEQASSAAPQGIRLSDIEPNPRQPRQDFDPAALEELAQSIRENGVITPITLRKTGDTYQIIAGERRWRASRMAGLHEIPAVVLDVDENTAYALALIENLQREDLNPMEEAEGYRRLTQELGLTQEQAARRVGISRPAVANALRLLSLPKAVAALLRDKEISAGHARALLPLEDPERMEQAAKTVIGQQLSVRQTELLVKRLLSQPKDAPEKQPDIYVTDLERAMEALTGHRIAIQPGAKKGRVVIEYYGNEDLEAVCDALKSIKKQNN